MNRRPSSPPSPDEGSALRLPPMSRSSPRPKPVEVYLEIGPRRTFACARLAGLVPLGQDGRQPWRRWPHAERCRSHRPGRGGVRCRSGRSPQGGRGAQRFGGHGLRRTRAHRDGRQQAADDGQGAGAVGVAPSVVGRVRTSWPARGRAPQGTAAVGATGTRSSSTWSRPRPDTPANSASAGSRRRSTTRPPSMTCELRSSTCSPPLVG